MEKAERVFVREEDWVHYVKADPHRPRWAQRLFRKRVRLYVPGKIIRHTVTGLKYCGGKKIKFYVVSFTYVEEDLEDKLTRILDDVDVEVCSPTRRYLGYEMEEVELEEAWRDSFLDYIWPEYLVKRELV